MSNVLTKDIIGPALDWAVAVADSHRVAFQSGHLYLVDERQRRIAEWRPSTAYAQGGPILEREGIGFYKANESKWWAQPYGGEFSAEGPTSLIAAMRCYVMSELGAEVRVPEEIL